MMIKRKRNKSNLVNERKLIIPCKYGGLCIKHPSTMADVVCIGCEREIIR